MVILLLYAIHILHTIHYHQTIIPFLFYLLQLAYKQVQRRKGEIAQKAGVKEIRLHDFRHNCASFLVNNGTPVTMVSKYLGHSNSSETLNTYYHLFNTTSSEVINTINRVRNTVEN